MKKNKILIVVLALAFIFLNSCHQDKIESETNKHVMIGDWRFPDFKEQNCGLGNIKFGDTLKILVEFSDCGEWGGHNETVFLYRSNNNKIVGRLKKDTVSCSNIASIYDPIDKRYYSSVDDRLRKVAKDTTKILTENDEKIMNLFLHRILELYLNEKAISDDSLIIYADAGRSIRIINTDLTMNLYYNNIDQFANTWFGIVRKFIFGLKGKSVANRGLAQ